MLDAMEQPDFLVIGSGAGGSTAFNTLSLRGLDVLMVEEGRQWTTGELNKPISQITSEIYRQNGVTPIFGSPTVAFGEGRCLGGTTEVNGALLWRTPNWILNSWLKSGLSLWSQDGMDPYFNWVETRLGVRLEPDVEGSNLDSLLLEQGAKSLGWQVSVVPRAAPGCVHSNRCGSGCPVGGKSSMSQTLIPEAVAHGGRVRSNVRVDRLTCAFARVVQVDTTDLTTGQRVVYRPKHVVLSAGATQSALILRKSKISNDAGRSFCFHLNLKLVAKFPKTIDATNGTIFTRQIQQFAESDGILIMPTNLTPAYLAMAFSHLGGKKLTELVEQIRYLGLFTVQVQPETRGRTIRLGNRLILSHQLNWNDWQRITKSITKAAESLFAAGADFVLLPAAGAIECSNIDEVLRELENTRRSNFQISSVHMMSANKMGTNSTNSIINQEGRVWDLSNLFVFDSSSLPSWTCESPQGTIMAMVKKLTEQNFL